MQAIYAIENTFNQYIIPQLNANTIGGRCTLTIGSTFNRLENVAVFDLTLNGLPAFTIRISLYTPSDDLHLQITDIQITDYDQLLLILGTLRHEITSKNRELKNFFF